MKNLIIRLFVCMFVAYQTPDVHAGNKYISKPRVDYSIDSTQQIKLDFITDSGLSAYKKLSITPYQIKKDELLTAHNPNPIASLSGKTSGLQVKGLNFNGSIHIRLRGNNSIFQNNQPLVIWNDIPLLDHSFSSFSMQTGFGGYDYGSLLNDLNTFDVQTIEIIKSNAASFMYGSLGQNGVLRINTNHISTSNKKFQLELNTGISFENVSNTPKLQNEYGAGYGSFDQQVINGKTYDLVPYSVDESWGPKYDTQKQVVHWWGAADYQEGSTSTPQTAPWIAPKNAITDFYETGIQIHNSVDISLHKAKSTLHFNYTNLHRTGTMPNSSHDKNNLSTNYITSSSNNKFNLQANLQFIHNNTKGRPSLGYSNQSVSRIFYQAGQRQLDVDKLKNYLKYEGIQRAWNRVSWDNSEPTYSDNPYWIAYKNYQNDVRIRGIGAINLNYKLSKHFSLNGNIGLDSYHYLRQERIAIGSVLQSYFGKAEQDATMTFAELLVHYQKSWNAFDLVAQVGSHNRNTISHFSRGESNGGLNNLNDYSLSNSVQSPNYLNESSQINELSGYGQIQVEWKKIYQMHIGYSKDAYHNRISSINTDGYLSLGGNILLSNALNISWIDQLNLRLNYGEAGSTPYISPIYSQNGTSASHFPNTVGNYASFLFHLKPEFTQEWETGIDAYLFNSRIGFDLTLYHRTTKNQIIPYYSTATTSIQSYMNGGTVLNEGIELSFLATPIAKRHFSWNLSLNYTKNRDKVTALIGSEDKILIAKDPLGGGQVYAALGSSVQSLFGYDFIYDKAGNKVIDEQTGFYSRTGALTNLGSSLPNYTIGVQNNFRFKKLQLSVLTEASVGGKYYSLSHINGMSSGMLSATVSNNDKGNPIRNPVSEGGGLLLEGVNGTVTVNNDGSYTVSNTKPNTTYIEAKEYGSRFNPVYGTPTAPSIFDATSIRVRELAVKYTLPPFSKSIQYIQISLYSRNLFVWGLDNPNIDPETIISSTGNVTNLEGGAYPSTRTFGINLNITF